MNHSKTVFALSVKWAPGWVDLERRLILEEEPGIQWKENPHEGEEPRVLVQIGKFCGRVRSNSGGGGGGRGGSLD